MKDSKSQVHWQEVMLRKCKSHNLKMESKLNPSIGWLDGKWGIEWVRDSDAKSFKIEQDPNDPQIFIFFDSIVVQLPEMEIITDEFLKDISNELG